MSQIIAVDFGEKRCGLAATDDLQIIASGLAGIFTSDIFSFFEKYFKDNKVEGIVVGLPTRLNGEISTVETEIQKFIEKFSQKYPEIWIDREDERFTSKMAAQAISLSGKNKKKRESKHLLDEVSAVLILQSYLEQKR